MKTELTYDQKRYAKRVGFTPKKVEDVLTMNYCIAWCNAYGKTFTDWFAAGFNNSQYSPVIDRRKSKILKMQMEAFV